MMRLALSFFMLAGAIWFSAFYKLGDKPLVGHLEDIYETPVVQQKVAAIQKKIYGSGEMVVEKSKKTPKPRPMAAVEPATATSEPAIIDSRPHTGQQQKAPAHDNLTEDDRDGLNHLLQKKLKN